MSRTVAADDISLAPCKLPNSRLPLLWGRPVCAMQRCRARRQRTPRWRPLSRLTTRRNGLLSADPVAKRPVATMKPTQPLGSGNPRWPCAACTARHARWRWNRRCWASTAWCRRASALPAGAPALPGRKRRLAPPSGWPRRARWATSCCPHQMRLHPLMAVSKHAWRCGAGWWRVFA